MSRRVLTKNALSGIVQVLMNAVVTFELYHFLNRHLTVSQIGTWSVVLASAATGRIIDLGLGGGVVKFVAQHMGANARPQAAATIQMALLGMAILFSVASIALFPLLYSGLSVVITDPNSLVAARGLLPYALCSLIVGALAGVTLSALDGCQRMDLRAVVGVFGSVVQLISAYFLVPKYDLKGLAVGQVVQSAVVFVSAALFLLRLIGSDLFNFSAWRKSGFKELIRYGSGFQAAAFGQLLFEPAVKAIMARYAGLEFTGYYEMASRLILQVRSLLVSGYQSLVPYVASTSKSDAELRKIYSSSYAILFYFSAAVFGAAGLILPFVLQFWIGRFAPEFLKIGDLCLIAWGLNTLNSPAYYIFLGIGELRWPVIAHSAIGISATLLGILFGRFFGGFGVLIAVAFVLVFGSHIVSYAFHVRQHIPLSELFPRESRSLIACAIVGSIAVLATTLHFGTSVELVPISICISFLLVLVSLSLINPNLRVLINLVNALRMKAGQNPVNLS
jgi:O-antigen/teichoic acid export membrane protein